MNDADEISIDKVAPLLEAYHRQLFDNEAPAIETSGLNGDEIEQFRKLRDCLVQLEQLREVERTVGSEGMPESAFSSADSKGVPVAGRIGRFEILRELGRGGLGVVFLARDEVLSRLVALKLPRPEVLMTSEPRERFDREAQTTARLTHPHLVPVYEVGQIGPIAYIVSAYCAGPNLAAWLKQRAAPLSARQAAQLIAPLADAVHYAHGQGVLHRDIKPSNVMLEPAPSEDISYLRDGLVGDLPFVPKLVDFGLARIVDGDRSHTRTGATIGSFGYMSPEQAEGRTADIGPATDVHALGSVLYECITGRAPYSGASDADCLRRIVSDEPRRPRHHDPRIPRDLEAICLKCLEKSPARRYESADALAADLRRFLAGEPSAARPLNSPQRGWRWARRRPSSAALAAVSLLALVTIIAGSTLYTIRLDRALDISEQRRIEAGALRDRAETNAQVARNNQRRVFEHVYVADMRVAWQLREEGELASLDGFLDLYRTRAGGWNQGAQAIGEAPDVAPSGHVVPGFEWRYLNRLRDAIRLKFKAHQGDINALAFSQRGDRLITASTQEGRACLWEIPSGRLMGSFAVRDKPMPAGQEEIAAISSDGRRVATLLDDRTVAVWEAESQSEVSRFTHKSKLHTVSFLSLGSQVACGGEGETVVWNCDSGETAHRYAAARLLSVSPDGKQLGLVDWRPASHKMQIFDVPASYPQRELVQSGPVKQICYSPDGTMIASLSAPRAWSDIRVYQPRTCELLLSNPGWVDAQRYSQIGFSGDSGWLAALVVDGSLKFWNSRTGLPSGSLRGPATRFTRFAFSADNESLATATPDGEVLIWNKARLESCERLLPANEVQGPLTYSSDGKHLAVATADRALLLIDAATCQVADRIPTHIDPIRDVAFSPAGDRLVTTDGEQIHGWDRSTAAQLWSVSAAYANCVAWSARDGLIASAGRDRQVHLYNADDGSKLAVLAGHQDEVTGLCFLPDSDLLISASLDATMRIWDVTTHKAIGEPIAADGPIDQIRLSAEGQSLVTGYRNGLLAVWKTGERRVERGKDSWFWEVGPRSAFSFTQDGKLLGIGGATGKFRAINLATREVLYTFSGRRVGARSIAYSPDARTLAVVSPEGCLTLWNRELWQTQTVEGAPLLTVRTIAFSHDGRTLAIATDDSAAASREVWEEVGGSPTVFGRAVAGARTGTERELPRRPWDRSGPGFRLWDVASGREQTALGELSTPTPIPIVAWSRQGVLAAGSNDGTVSIWQADRGTLLTRFSASSAGLPECSWQPQAGRAPTEHRILDQLDAVVGLDFAPSGEQLAVATRAGAVQVIGGKDWSDRVMLCLDATDVACVAFRPSGDALAANRGGALLSWNLNQLDLSRSPTTIGQPTDSHICSLAFSHDGRTLALGRQNGTVQFLEWKLPVPGEAGIVDQRWRTLKGHVDRVKSLSFSPDDRTLATGSWDTTVRLWHVPSAQEITALRAHHGKVEAVAFSPDGTVLATGGQRDADQGEVFLWRATRE